MARVDYVIRPIGRDEAVVWRELRLEALVNHPTAFSADPEAFRRLTLDEAAQRIPKPEGADVLFGAYLDDTLQGCAGFVVEKGAKERHHGFMWGVYLRPVLRGSGAAEALVRAVIEQARAHVDILNSAVNAENLGAKALYLRLGFSVYGTSPRALRVDGRDYDEDLLVMVLR
jgi:ribosomal protein S18 acetylase RimI-like enzyme